MLARKLFGKKATAEEPRRPPLPPQGQIFNEEIFEGEIGDFLRQHGFAPDDPKNQAINIQPVSVLLAEDQRALRKASEAVNSVAEFPLVPVHLMPPALWTGDFGPLLRQHLDLSPYRPWNTIFLPGDDRGAASFGLPVAPVAEDDPNQLEMARAILSCIHDQYAGKSAPDVEATVILLRGVRKNLPALFPPDTADFSDRVREARAQVRVYAFLHATNSGRISKETIIKSQGIFLGEPGQQLIA
ncbi:MAG TPA: hypothetical protein VGB39_01310 [Sphingomicrobium sp.]